jgi:hypothetical protein
MSNVFKQIYKIEDILPLINSTDQGRIKLDGDCPDCGGTGK